MTGPGAQFGDALFELCAAEGSDGEVLQQLAGVEALFAENPAYPRLLDAPNVVRAARLALVDEAFAGKVAPYLLNMLRLLCERAQACLLPQAAVRYRARYNEAHGIIEARAFTAQPLGEALRQKLSARLAALTGKQVLLTVQTDPALLGGIRLEMEGKEFDGTVRRRLDTLRRELLRAN